jgi:hypothetical protein
VEKKTNQEEDKMGKRDRDLNRQAIESLTKLFQHGIGLRADSIGELTVSRRALKIALESLKEVCPAAYAEFCTTAVEDKIRDW